MSYTEEMLTGLELLCLAWEAAQNGDKDKALLLTKRAAEIRKAANNEEA